MKNKFLVFCFSLFFIFVSGCQVFNPEKKGGYNPGLCDKDFQSGLSGKTIKLVAPASSVDSLEKIEKIKSIESLNIQAPPDLVDPIMIYHSNTDEKRLAFLKQALYDPSNDTIIWTLRGGYGSARLIDELKKLPKPKNQKIFIGYSDITALHLFLSQHWGWRTIHGITLSEFLIPWKDPQNLVKVAQIISGKKRTAEIGNLRPLNCEGRKIKPISGKLTGGNITIIETSLGTDWQIQTAGKILFLEDLKEQGYKLDRALNHLKQAGVLRNLKAIVFGHFQECPEDVDFALKRFASETSIPVFKTEQFGHGLMNYPLVYLAPSKIVENKETGDYKLIMNLRHNR